ncbi:hypothetical protein BWD09_07075 [Neisseria dentiae]|uniref:Uncharacterized protein n=1 Tax=Neisseria dentiae TaxID=194197 RepID=A0A1X3D9D2_9NEIS|nr:hypothetical protein [Neisseria dentiae]OSI16518.1 hypothetical protein BWD09_07075 [Neisseria dentiae]STZ49875.1 Uncharacterised protein [Neisseria dentiae]STZ49919.1 Uncharacterised protein [Neisseria dentiae]
MLRDDILRCLQMHGRQSAKEIALNINRPEKNVMRELSSLYAGGYVLYESINVVRYLKLRGWSIKSEKTRFYYLPIRHELKDDILRMRWTT